MDPMLNIAIRAARAAGDSIVRQMGKTILSRKSIKMLKKLLSTLLKMHILIMRF